MQILQGQEAEAMWALGRDFLSTSTVYKGWKDNIIMEKHQTYSRSSVAWRT